jgi:uncharacterized protein (DUF1810 family)
MISFGSCCELRVKRGAIEAAQRPLPVTSLRTRTRAKTLLQSGLKTVTDSDLKRFFSAQKSVLAQVSAELNAGRKETHWMWFIFPQLAGLGHSPAAQFYALKDLSHAQRYLAHPVLGTQLRQHVCMLLQHTDRTAREILGTPDDLKLQSCLTLFKAASPTREDQELFEKALQYFYSGEPDRNTLELMKMH